MLKTKFDAVNGKTVCFYQACEVYIEALYGPTTYRHIGPHVWELGGRQDKFYGFKDGHF